jgi:hypothetical protein
VARGRDILNPLRASGGLISSTDRGRFLSCVSPDPSTGVAVSDPKPEPNEVQRRYKEFLDLLPLTLALAGLPESERGRYFTEEQIETRVFAIRHAHKAARALARELVSK